MKNLKKMLALVLAMLMVFGVMAAASAAFSDFTDADKVTYDEAVSLMVELGVINGIKAADGSYYFDPTAPVTRAQTAKMISFVLSGGLDRGNVYASVTTGLTDIADNWAKGYINHCFTLNIIAGMGDGTFQPNGNVTGGQLAKMLLVALGYDAETQGLVGKDWLANTIVLAGSVGILENYVGDPTKALTREEAALLIYNALYAQMVTTVGGVVTPRTTTGYEWISITEGSGWWADTTYAAVTVSKPLTLLSEKFGMTPFTGIVYSNEFTGENAGFTLIGDRLYKVSTDLSLIGHMVTIYQKGSITSKNYYECFGDPVDVTATVSAVRSTKFNEGVSAQSYAAFLKTNGLKATDEDVLWFINYVNVDEDTFGAADFDDDSDKGVQLQLVDYDGDKVIDAVLMVGSHPAVVKAIDKATGEVTFEGVNDGPEFDYMPECIFGETDLAKGDYVLLTPISGDIYAYVEPATIVTATVTKKITAPTSFVAGGTTYSFTGSFIAFDALTLDDLNFGVSYDLILDANGYVAAAVSVTNTYASYELSKVLAYWKTTATDALGKTTTYSAYIVFPDGTKGSYKIASYNSKNPSATGATTDLNTVLPAAAAENNVALDPASDVTIEIDEEDVAIKTLLDYGFVYATVNSDGKLVLKEASIQYAGTNGIKFSEDGTGITKGVAKLAGADAYANSATSFYYIASGVSTGILTLDPSDAVYTGIANAPTDTGADMYIAYYTTKTGTNVAAAVYWGDSEAATYKDLYYSFGNNHGWAFDPDAGTNVFDVPMYLAGALQDDVPVAEADLPGMGFYGSYKIDSYGNYKYTAVASADVDWTATTNGGWCTAEVLGALYENYLTVGAYFGFVTDSTKLVVAPSLAGYGIDELSDIYGILADTAAADKAIVSASFAANGNITAIYVEFIGIPT